MVRGVAVVMVTIMMIVRIKDDVDSNFNCGDDVDGDGSDSNDVDGAYDGNDVNINGGDNATCVDGENIVNCCDDKDGGDDGDIIDDSGFGTDGDRDFEDDKTKADCREDTAGDDGISNDNGGPNYGGCVNTNDNDFGGDGTDSDGDNNNNNNNNKNNNNNNDNNNNNNNHDVDVDKNDGDENDADDVSNNEGGENADSDDKDDARDDDDNKDHIDFEGNDQEFFETSFIKVSTTYGANLSFPDSVRCK